MNIAVILAGGIGSRFGADIPKQFVEVFGKPIIAYTLEPFENHPNVDAILVVCVKPYVEYIWELKNKYNFSKLIWVTEGGSTFQESMINGVNFLADKAKPNDIVLFHFAASPFIKSDIISDVIKVCEERGTNAISTTDYYLLSGKKKSLKSVLDKNNYTDEYINRDSIAVMNTPHAFRYQFIADMYKEAIEKGILDTVEPHTTTLMYAMGKRIYFSKGSQSNIKITTKEDIELFEGYVLEQQRKQPERVSADVVVFMADGFEEGEALVIVDMLRRAGLKTIMASIMGRRDVVSSRNIVVETDCLAENVNYNSSRMVVLPGGRVGTNNLKQSQLVLNKCKEFAKDKYVAAICAAPSILASLNLLKKVRVAVHPDFERNMDDAILTREDVVTDKNIITGAGLGTTFAFSLKIVESLLGQQKAKELAKSILYSHYK